ncbi:MAG: hypothetical protein EA001_15770 [Oscillatoriales cyanobacterium]|nr:MAG: hypothetical protein EA001_15770 [Oscillatoriales cyanobacterium]
MVATDDNTKVKLGPQRSYSTLIIDGQEVGWCTVEFADRLSESFGRDAQSDATNTILRRAFKRVCTDLLAKMGGNPHQLGQLMQRYLEAVMRPDTGPRAIAYLLRDRQTSLGMSNQEFVQFCDSYRLSPPELKEIYDGRPISDAQLKNISRIVGRTAQELADIRDGGGDSETDRLAQSLGMSVAELTEWLSQ